jgi:DNA-binding CsgD family transcriptional regulator
VFFPNIFFFVINYHFEEGDKNLGRKICRIRRNVKMYSLGPRFEDIYFSKREAECMVYLFAMEIAKKLGLSRRTIEFYIKNMKKKLDCQNKDELITLVENSACLVNLAQ